MKNYLYFASAAPEANAANEEVACFPADQLSHMEMATATQMRIYFESSQEADEDSGIDAAHVVLTITSGKHKEAMQEIVEAVNRPSGGNFGFINIADSENSKFCSEHITACASMAVVDAS